MGLAATAREVVTRAREYIQDRNGARWTDADMLQMLDQAHEDIRKSLRKSSQQWDIDSIVLQTSTFTKVAETLFEVSDLPETVGHIVGVWLKEGEHEFPILEGAIYDIPRQYSGYERTAPIWSFTGPGHPGTLKISGNRLTRFNEVRVVYIRRYPQLHYTLASGSGITSSTTTTAVLPADSALAGSVTPRDDVYTGLSVVFEGSGSLRRITAFDGGTRTITFSTLSPAPTGQYSLVVPMPPDTEDYLAVRTAYVAAMRMGNQDYIESMERQVGYGEQRFRESIANRAGTSPRSVWSSRH